MNNRQQSQMQKQIDMYDSLVYNIYWMYLHLQNKYSCKAFGQV